MFSMDCPAEILGLQELRPTEHCEHEAIFSSVPNSIPENIIILNPAPHIDILPKLLGIPQGANVNDARPPFSSGLRADKYWFWITCSSVTKIIWKSKIAREWGIIQSPTAAVDAIFGGRSSGIYPLRLQHPLLYLIVYAEFWSGQELIQEYRSALQVFESGFGDISGLLRSIRGLDSGFGANPHLSDSSAEIAGLCDKSDKLKEKYKALNNANSDSDFIDKDFLRPLLILLSGGFLAFFGGYQLYSERIIIGAPSIFVGGCMMISYFVL